MKKSIPYIFVFLISYFILVSCLLGHVPLKSGHNESIKNALFIRNFKKSWAIYDKLDRGGDARYFRFEMKKGDRLHLSLFTPEKDDFNPAIIVIGASFSKNPSVSDFIEIPEGYGTLLLEGKKPTKPEYEPFTPSAYYERVAYDLEASDSGTYFIAVSDSARGGKFGMAIGYIESFSIAEWLLIPLNVLHIHLWEGQNIIVILGPMLLILVIGIVILIWRRIKLAKGPQDLWNWVSCFSGLLYIGSSAMTLYQMTRFIPKGLLAPSMGITGILIAIPIILGIFVLGASLRQKIGFKLKDRIRLFLLGILGLAFWAGVLVGPLLIILLSIFPRLRMKTS